MKMRVSFKFFTLNEQKLDSFKILQWLYCLKMCFNIYIHILQPHLLIKAQLSIFLLVHDIPKFLKIMIILSKPS